MSNLIIIIVVLSQHLNVKSEIENERTSAGEASCIKAYISMLEFGHIANKEGMPLKEVFLQKVKAQNCDSIFAIRLIT